MKLSNQQKSIIKEILKFKNPVQKLAGYAGTGKSCVIKHLCEVLPNFAVCAYTGKAVSVLKKRGITNASTIHSLIYRAYEDENNHVRFELCDRIDYEGIIVDEASMVGKDIYYDLLSFKKPVIFVGDHGQLEPIGDLSYNLMENADYVLTEIHRNAGEIAHFANYIRNGYRPSSWQHRNGCSDKIKFLSKNSYDQVITEVDQIICAYNKTRAKINIDVREKLGRKIDFPQISDRIICLKNNKSKGIFNGMQGYIGWFHDKNFIQFVSDICVDVKIDLSLFNCVKYDIEYFEQNENSPNPFDYAYCLTCHKAISDEFDKVLVIEQKCDLWTHSKWCYTAATRAKEKLYWCSS